jgi:FkbM family methyltransferase
MLIPAQDVYSFWLVRTKGIVHVGAHLAEEANLYRKFSFGPVIWIEAQPDLVKILQGQIHPPDKVIRALVWSEAGVHKTLRLASNSQSSSIFDFGTHELSHPEVVFTGEIEMRTSTLMDVLPNELSNNMLVLDIQGAEYEALQGLGEKIEMFDYVYCEVSRKGVFKQTHEVFDIDTLLSEAGFLRVATMWTRANWGDALYVRESVVPDVYGSTFRLRARMVIYKLWSTVRMSKMASFTHKHWRKMISRNRAR